jgi:hypothetical protein
MPVIDVAPNPEINHRIGTKDRTVHATQDPTGDLNPLHDVSVTLKSLQNLLTETDRVLSLEES